MEMFCPVEIIACEYECVCVVKYFKCAVKKLCFDLK